MADPIPGPEPRGRSITLAVRLFAGLREQAGWGERRITLSTELAGLTPSLLWQLLQIGRPGTPQGTPTHAGLLPSVLGDWEHSRLGWSECPCLESPLPESSLPESSLPESVRVAVNQSFAEGDQLLVDGDEVAFLPAISGG